MIARLAAGFRTLGLLVRHFYVWTWSVEHQQWDLRLTRFGRSVATVWPNGTWHTWDRNGCGGWNDQCRYCDVMRFEDRHFAAKREAWVACDRQGFLMPNASRQRIGGKGETHE